MEKSADTDTVKNFKNTVSRRESLLTLLKTSRILPADGRVCMLTLLNNLRILSAEGRVC